MNKEYTYNGFQTSSSYNSLTNLEKSIKSSKEKDYMYFQQNRYPTISPTQSISQTLTPTLSTSILSTSTPASTPT